MSNAANYVEINGQFVSAGYAKSHPEISGNNLSAGVRAEKPKSDKWREGEDRGMENRKTSVHHRVTFTVLRRRLLDRDDNANSACKALRDLVALSLGFKDDSDPKISFNYSQAKSATDLGTLITIEEIPQPQDSM